MTIRLVALNVFILLCLKAGVCDDNGKCYTVITNRQVTWEQAEEFCEKNFTNGRLASVHSTFDDSIIGGWLPFLTTNPWIGAFRIGNLSFTWSDGSDFNDYKNWAASQPSDRCAQVCRTTTTSSVGNLCQQGKWITASCSRDEAQIICEYGNLDETATVPTVPSCPTPPPPPSCPTPPPRLSCPTPPPRPTCPTPPPRPTRPTPPPRPSCPDQWTFYSQACYRTFLNAVSWSDAEAACRNNGGHLTSIHSLAENNFIAELASTHSLDDNLQHQTWIGMIDLKHNRQWSWSDGSSMNYLYWSFGEPNNNGGTEFCVEMYTERLSINGNVRYHWNDYPCYEPMRAFVCKKMKEKSD